LRTVEPDQALEGVTPNAFVAAFEGTHTTTLRWNAAGEADDEITVVVLARTSPSARDVCGQLEVTVDFALATRDHGLLESRTVTLRGAGGQLESASLYVQGERVRLSATLTATGGDVRIAGTLLSDDPALPSDEATFPAPE
jgi:hypothetical protein